MNWNHQILSEEIEKVLELAVPCFVEIIVEQHLEELRTQEKIQRKES